MIIKYWSLILGLMLALAAPCYAQPRNFEWYTAEVPAGWEASEMGPNLVDFIAPGDADLLFIGTGDFLYPHQLWLAQSFAENYKAQENLRRLPADQGFVLSNSEGERIWLTEIGGRTLLVGTGGPHRELAGLMRSIKTTEEGALAEHLDRLLQTPGLLDWLLFINNDPPGERILAVEPPVKPDFSQYGGEDNPKASPPPLAEAVPTGWRHQNIGPWSVMESEDGLHWAAARYYPLTETDLKVGYGLPLEDTATALAARLGGRNLNVSEGVMYFTTPAGLTEFGRIDKKTGQLTIYSDKETVQAVFGFARSEAYDF